jgi:2-polyprenyl-3-methyl-5-hydroxy-6-metoxy-1,4-benzoquinol methylase
MNRVTVDLNSESLYSEPNSKFYRVKRKLTYKTVLKIFRSRFSKFERFSVLEIGTGSGFLVDFLEDEFPNAEITGLEFDPRLVELTQAKLKRAKIVQGNAENFDFPSAKFDIIVSLQVIEHLYHPEQMIEKVKQHLKVGGIFLLTTPNLECISAKVMKEKWHGFRNDHVSLKNVKEWESIVNVNGFETIYCGSTFVSGIPLLNRFPLGVFNWALLFFIGSMRWKYGESFIGVFKNSV